MKRETSDQQDEVAAGTVLAGFAGWRRRFAEITARAPRRFAARDWKGHQADAVERLHLYSGCVAELVEALGRRLGHNARRPEVWAGAKRRYAATVAGSGTEELAQTFFSSVTRRVFAIEGVAPEIEFVPADTPGGPAPSGDGLLRRYELDRGAEAVLLQVLGDAEVGPDFDDLRRQAALGGRRLEQELSAGAGAGAGGTVEMLQAVFYRNKAAYLVGRVVGTGRTIPLVLPLLHGPRGVVLDAVLTDEDEVSILFSFTRSHFHATCERPAALVAFLRSILPLKPLAELYIAVGFHKHGKTLLYRDLRAHLARSSEKFIEAPGDRGMVMIVFTLPGYDRVYKVIRDTFAYPKSTTVQEVMRRYRLVFERDRVGRLVEAQTFAHLEFDRRRFSAPLLEELLRDASRTVRLEGDRLLIEHLYVERRVRPLNLYVREVGPGQAARVVVEYGRAIKDLAAVNIFPGDFLLKNFGVTRHGRVVFYDYDELGLVTDCRFARIPPPRTPEDELAAEPWFAAGEHDVYPEEFRIFLDLPGPLLEVFERYHGELFTADYWTDLQRRHQAGELPDFCPYPAVRRLRRLSRGTPGGSGPA